MPRQLISNLLGLVGAGIGGVLGFYTFGWLVGQGFYGPMIPGISSAWDAACSPSIRQPSAESFVDWLRSGWDFFRSGGSGRSTPTKVYRTS